MYMDAPLGLALTYNSRLLAHAAFGPYDHSTLKIVQIQGNKQNLQETDHRNIDIFDVTKIKLGEVMIELLKKYCQETGYDKLVIQCAAKNRWVNNGHVSERQLRGMYDKPAIALGARKNEHGNFELHV